MPKNPPTPGARVLKHAGAFAKDDAAHLSVHPLDQVTQALKKFDVRTPILLD
jgi:hypothetical protein